MLAPELAMRMGRPHMSRTAALAPGAGAADPSGQNMGLSLGGSAAFQGEVATGRLSLAMLVAIIVGLGGFYFWTRDHEL